jgi:peptide/nickel transport system substrate-binding protein
LFRLRSAPAIVACLTICFCFAISGTSARAAQTEPASHPEYMVEHDPVGRTGGRLVISLGAEPKTLNPVMALEQPSRDVIGLLMADLVHINRGSQLTEPALAKSWKISRDGLHYTLTLRRGLRFSDGQPFTASDVVFTFQVYLDARLGSPQRDLLIVGGKPIEVRELGPYKVEFDFAQPYAPAERIFDSIAILPKHLLESAYRSGKIGEAWGLNTPPDQIAGLGPFRLKEYVSGQRIVLEKNPYYWKVDSAKNRLPYLDEIDILFVPTADAQAIRFASGDLDVLNGFSAANYSVLERQEKARGFHLYDLGPGLEYYFVFFNLNDLPKDAPAGLATKQAWFRDVRFRQAVSAAIDRQAIVRLVYQGRATPIWEHVTPGNKLWLDNSIPEPPRSLDRAKQSLRSAGFSWQSDGTLVDPHGLPVEFSILTNTSNSQRAQIATLLQNDLQQLGMHVSIVSLEFRAMLDRLFHTFDYEASLLSFGSGDVDPTPEMNVWMSDGSTHIWHLGEKQPATPWEAELDRLMREQLVTMKYAKRKAIYDRVQEIVANQLPVICLVSPDILVGAKSDLGNFRPAILTPHALWNVEELYWTHPQRGENQ